MAKTSWLRDLLEILRIIFGGYKPDPPQDPDPLPPVDPEPPTVPDPEPPAPPQEWEPTMGWLAGTPQARIYEYGKNIFDATPALIAPKRCQEIFEKYGWFKDRYACPVAPDDHPLRGFLEVELMGGERPVWELEVIEGALSWVWLHDWKAKITGRGRGRIRWSFPNGRARSKWIKIDKKR